MGSSTEGYDPRNKLSTDFYGGPTPAGPPISPPFNAPPPGGGLIEGITGLGTYGQGGTAPGMDTFGGTIPPAPNTGVMIPGRDFGNRGQLNNPQVKGNPTPSPYQGGLIATMTSPAQTPTPMTPTPMQTPTIRGGKPGETLEMKRARIEKNRAAKRSRGEIT